MHIKPLFFSIYAFLCILSPISAGSQPVLGEDAPLRLRAAECGLQAGGSVGASEKNALLLQKADLLATGGDCAGALETIKRISRFALSKEELKSLIYRHLDYSYRASEYEEFGAVLQEALQTGLLDAPDSAFAAVYLASQKPARRSEGAAMLLSLIPGAGNAYAGDFGRAAGYFAAEGAAIAAGIAAFSAGLYLGAFLGAGMLLYSTMPKSTAEAVQSTEKHNQSKLGAYYAPIFEMLCSPTRNRT